MLGTYKSSYNIYQYFLILMVFWFEHAWFTWILDEIKILGYCVYFLFFLVAFNYRKKCHIQIRFTEKQILVVTLFTTGVLLSMSSIKDIIQDLIVYPPLLVMAADSKNSKDHLRVISKVIGITIIVGFVPYLLWLSDGLNMPNRPIVYGEYDVFYNYFLMIVPSVSYTGFRYQSVFLEPGNLGTLCALFLFVNNYNLKKYYNVFFLIGLLFSLSLGGYVIALIGYFMYIGLKRKKIIVPLLAGAALYAAFLYIPKIDSGDNDVNTMIIERLQYDDEKGIAGNDRFHGSTDKLYKESFQNGKIWFGLSSEEYQSRDIDGSGYKIYILHHGLIAYILIWLFFWVEAHSRTSKRRAIIICLVLYMCFLKSTDVTSYAWFIPFFLYINSEPKVIRKQIAMNKRTEGTSLITEPII